LVRTSSMAAIYRQSWPGRMIARPDHLTVRPNLRLATMIDPLSEVLRSVRLTGGIFLDARFTAPWCVHTNILAEDCGAFQVKPPLLIAYHFVIAGKVLLSIEGETTVEVRAGEIALLPRNDVHTLASGPGPCVNKRTSSYPAVRGRRTGANFTWRWRRDSSYCVRLSRQRGILQSVDRDFAKGAEA
jgi:mannose-6-phosphate isomerase-like protein (cupin superfamily)